MRTLKKEDIGKPDPILVELAQRTYEKADGTISGGGLDEGKYYQLLKEVFGKDIPWANREALYEAIAFYAEEHHQKSKEPLDGRMGLLSAMCRDCFRKDGNFLLLDPWLNGELLGNKEKWVSQRKVDVKNYQIGKWGGGYIENSFEPKEIQRISSGDMSSHHHDMKEDLLMMDAKEGTGKSKLIAAILKAEKPTSVLIVSHSIACALRYAEELEVEFYKRVGLWDKKSEGLSEKQRKEKYFPTTLKLSTTIDSLHYIRKDGKVPAYDFVIIDEINHNLERTQEERNGIPERKDKEIHRKNYRCLLEACWKAGKVILADASASDLLTGSFISQIEKHQKRTKKLLINNHDYLQDMEFVGFDTESQLFRQAIDDIKAGKILMIFSDVAGRLEPWRAALCKDCGLEDWQIETHDRETEAPIKGHNADEYINKQIDKGVKAFILSPWCFVGWDTKTEKIDKAFSVMNGNYIAAHDIKQAHRRARFVTDHAFFINPQRNFLDGEEEIEDEFAQLHNQGDTYSEISTKENAQYYARKESIRAHFISMIDEAGANVSFSKNEGSSTLKETLKQAKEDQLEALKELGYQHALCGWDGKKAYADDEDLKAWDQYRKFGNGNALLALLDAEDTDLSKLDKENSSYLIFQKTLFRKVIELFEGYTRGKKFFDWLTSDEKEIKIHISGTEQSEAVNECVKNNQVLVAKNVDIPLFTGKAWRESSHGCVKLLAQHLFLETRRTAKKKDVKQSNGKSILQASCENRGIKYERRVKDAKDELRRKLIEERDYNAAAFDILGDTLTLKKRDVVPQELLNSIHEYLGEEERLAEILSGKKEITRKEGIGR